MHKRNNQITALTLLLIISFQAAGYIGAFKVWQLKIKEEIKRNILDGIPNDKLTVIKISRNDQQVKQSAFKIEEENELRYNDEMYDIVRNEVHSDTVWYFCLPDRNETQLLSVLVSLVGKQIEQNSTTNHQFQHFFTISQLQYLLEETTNLTTSSNRMHYSSENSIRLTDPFLFSISYPPKLNSFS